MSELCLKNETVLTLKDNQEGVPCEIIKINNPELLPVSLKRNCTIQKFSEWLNKRTIPSTREGLADMIQNFGEEWLITKNYASLSDHYWLKIRDERWEKVNFFTRHYSLDIGNIAFSPWTMYSKKRIDPNSPDLTTNGVLKKCWKQNNDLTSYLLKAESLKTHQEPLSEVLVSVLCEQLGGIKSAGYSLHVEGTTMCSKCENFVTLDNDLVTAADIYFDEKPQNNETTFVHLLKMCEKFDIPNAEDFLRWVIFIDNITGNEDRNLSNIGFLRNMNTMKFIGPAPLFDCASAFWNTKKVNAPAISKTFGDVETAVFAAMKNKCNLNILAKDWGYMKLIDSYPCIHQKKKENLIAEINKRNKIMCNDLSFAR